MDNNQKHRRLRSSEPLTERHPQLLQLELGNRQSGVLDSRTAGNVL